MNDARCVKRAALTRERRREKGRENVA
jgi:hypothetical protein